MWASQGSSMRRSGQTDAASAVSGYSAATNVRHAQFAPTSGTASMPNPKLTADSSHTPKTHGSFGILVVGLGGANGTTMLAGILANRLKVDWFGPKGESMTPNYNGCITQLDQRGVHGGVGYRDVVKGLADASMAAVGGWDIRSRKLGDALLENQILDYDLARQVRDEMNGIKLFRGLYDPRFIGSSQHATANYVLTEQEARSDAEALKCLRADIRYFKWRNGVVGHTTVIWSASVEPNSDLVPLIASAEDLLQAIDMSEEERGGPIPPSLLYATAAILEGCSFVNGGSQNTLACPGLAELAQQQLGVYCLGTDFKAGQTKFKTAAVEYIRTMGLTPKVIASSNHLGNNDMRNLASAKSASNAKLKVKHDIFAPWQEEDLDHKVSIMFTPYINDDKRDFVEYTSLGFLGQTHTMVTYTRASDSVLCVPLMIDAAVWCDYFSQRSWSYEKVGKALAYLFKVPEGAAKGVDPGFFRQMEELKSQVLAAHNINSKGKHRRVRIRPTEQEDVASEWAIPADARIVCAGLGCVDMQLNQATGEGGEGIETFDGEKSIGGGSVSMACKTIARLCHGAPLDDGYMQATLPVVSSVIPLCMVGNDDSGHKLLRLLEQCGSTCRNVDTSIVRNAQSNKEGLRTALSVLPIFQDGRRGCFFDAASNTTFSPSQMVEMFLEVSSAASTAAGRDSPPVGAMVFGYPHLLPLMQGESLAKMLSEARKVMYDGGILALDLNGVPEIQYAESGGQRNLQDLGTDRVIGAALKHVDLLHMNEDELSLLTGCEVLDTPNSQENEYVIAKAAELFLRCGVAVVAITRGKQGSYVACNSSERLRQTPAIPQSWANCSAHMPAASISPGASINTNGAGDSFISGLLVATMLRHTGKTAPMAEATQEKVAEAPTPADGDASKAAPKKKLTPYSIYMKEKYMSLKMQYNDDKKVIFSKCHEMWENEKPGVKAMYERMAREENEEEGVDMSKMTFNDAETNLSIEAQSAYVEGSFDNSSMINQSLNLESAVNFAGLVAARHVDMNTRDLEYLDVRSLLAEAMIFPSGPQEI